MHKILWTVLGFWLCGLLVAVAAETFPLTDGTTISGKIVSATDQGVIFRTAGGKYSDRLPWTRFSQAGLKQFAQDPKIEPLVEAFIEKPSPLPVQKAKITLREVPRLERSAPGSLFGALFTSPVGLVVLLLIYAANFFAAYEVALFRSRPRGVVVGVSAVLPILGPIIFLSMVPSRTEVAPPEETPMAAPVEESEPHRFAMPGTPAPVAAAVAAPVAEPVQEEIHIVASGFHGEPPPEPPSSTTEVFQRGQYMFNRRFFETKFPGFFGIARGEGAIGKVLMFKTTSTLITIERISSISASDVHVEVVQGGERHEMVVPFTDIQQIQLKSKNA